MLSCKLLRLTAHVVLVTFGSLVAQPVIAGLNTPPAQTRDLPATTADRYADALQRLQAALDRAAAQRGQGRPDSAELGEADAAGASLDALESDIEADFDATDAHLVAHGLAPEIRERQRLARQDFQARKIAFKQKLQAYQQARRGQGDPAAAADALRAWLGQYPNGRPHTPTDPNNLPFRTPEADIRPPIETEAGYRNQLFKPQPIRLAAAGSLSGIPLPGTTPPATPTAADLAETEDIQLTPAIRAQAAELGNTPVAIHNWVRNTIEFIPSYGSLQGADLTLQTKRGNAFDTASLEIALLRAAGIPARYVYGTIEVPAQQAMNWVGGVSTPQAAQSLLGQGGIPTVGVYQGGVLKSLRLEHVWVEAWVDYVPSRGAANREGDTWVPLDASFKQYTHTPGLDLQAAVPLEAASLLEQLKQGATINEAEGWVQNLNASALQSQLSDYQNRVRNYLDTTHPDATVGDVLGRKTIQPETPPILLGSLPYPTLALGARLQALPDNLKWRFRTTLADTWGGELAHLNQTTPTLAGKKLTISFHPASPADLDLINSYLPKPHADGTPIQPSELPTRLPGYLIKLKAEIRLDGQLVSQSTASVTMGSGLKQSSAYYNPGRQQWEEGEANHPLAGEYHALALDLQGISASQLTALKTKLEQTKAKLEQFQQNPDDSTPIQNLSKEDLSGDLLYSGILGYYASVDGADQLAAKANGNIVAYRQPSYGSFAATAQPHTWFGIVRSVSFPGVAMDIDRLSYQVEAKDGDPAKKVAYLRQVGSAGSAFEHAVPERLFADPTKPPTDPSQPQGISAVKAIAIAAANGQKVYTLNSQNQAYHQSIVQGLNTDAETKTEITNALNAGLEVTVHQSDITAHGWTGSGYILLDPETGAGAYKISGGANGGYLTLGAYGAGTILLAVVGFTGLYVALPFVIALMILTAALVVAAMVLEDLNTDYNDAKDFIGLCGLVLATALLLTKPAVVVLIGAANIPLIAAALLALVFVNGAILFGKYVQVRQRPDLVEIV